LDISFHDDSSLNVNEKKRTLSETMEDELLGATAIAMTHDYDIDEDVVGDDDDNDDDDDACDAEVESKQQHQGHTSDSEENTEVK
jgi:hypothetical protein